MLHIFVNKWLKIPCIIRLCMQYNVWRNFTTLLLLSLFNFHDFDNILLSFLCNLPDSKRKTL